MRQNFTDQLAKLSQKLVDLQTDPNIATAIMEGLPSEGTSFYTPCQSLRTAVQHQDSIGWQATMEGLLALEWQGHQAEYYCQLGSQRRAHTWAASVSLALTSISHGMWNTRNRILHPRGEHSNTSGFGQAQEQIVEELLHTDPGTLLVGDQHLLTSRTPQEIRRMSPTDQGMWIASLEEAQQTAMEERHSGIQGQRRIMRNWLAQP
jgi:hypothetical protein